MEDRMSIVIAQRLSTILAAYLILVMDREQIVERCTGSPKVPKWAMRVQRKSKETSP